MQLGLQLSHLSGVLLAQGLLPGLQGMLTGVVASPWQHFSQQVRYRDCCLCRAHSAPRHLT